MGETLLPRNQVYYKQISDYVSNTLWLQTDATNATLAQIKADLLRAQADGRSPNEFFGADAETVAKQIVAGIPRQPWRDRLLLFIAGYGLALLVVIAMNLYLGGHRHALGSQAVLALVLYLIMTSAGTLTRHWGFKPKRQQWGLRIVFCALIGLGLATYTFLPEFGFVTFSPVVLVSLSGVAVLTSIALGVWLGKAAPWAMTLLGTIACLFFSRIGLRELFASSSWPPSVGVALVAGTVIRGSTWLPAHHQPQH